MRILKIIIIGSVLFTLTVFGQGKGTITGKVRDSKTNDGLPSVNVKIKGTYYGAASDFEGNYIIKNINPGSYTVEFLVLGYKTVQHTGVKIEAGQTLTLDQKLEETVLTLDQEVLIVG